MRKRRYSCDRTSSKQLVKLARNEEHCLKNEKLLKCTSADLLATSNNKNCFIKIENSVNKINYPIISMMVETNEINKNAKNKYKNNNAKNKYKNFENIDRMINRKI